MTEEVKNVEENHYDRHHECSCHVFSKFLMLTFAVFLGSLLAILVAKALTQPSFPSCPCMMKHFNKPMYEKEFYPPVVGEHPMMKHEFKGDHHKFDKKKFEKMNQD